MAARTSKLFGFVQVYGGFCNTCSWFLTLLIDCLDSNSKFDYEDDGVGFKIWKHPKMTLYSQISPISHFNLYSMNSGKYIEYVFVLIFFMIFSSILNETFNKDIIIIIYYYYYYYP